MKSFCRTGGKHSSIIYSIIIMTTLNGGYPTEWFVKEPSKNFICGICLNVLNNPHQCKNGHNFCLSCISAALEVNRECPTCKTALKVEKLTVNLGMKNLIEEMLVVKCCNEVDDDETCLPCNWIGSLEQCSDHFALCDQRQISCPLHAVGMCFDAECSGQVKRNQLSDHILSDKKPSDLADLIVILAKTVDSQAKEIKKLHDICVNENSVRDVVIIMGDDDDTKIDQISFDDDHNLEGDCILKSVRDNSNNEYDIAVGSYVDSSLNGWGAVYSSNSTYYGEWKDGDRHGYGLYHVFEKETHYVYHGMFKHDKLDGYGQYHELQTGVKYIGHFKNDTKHGKGAQSFSDGSVFRGVWKDGTAVEPGAMRFLDGSVFVGTVGRQWEIKCGKLTSHDGIVYMGDFKPTANTCFNGNGTITYLDGSVYTGPFVNGMRHGMGKYCRVGGESVQLGDWDKDVFTCIDEKEIALCPHELMVHFAVLSARDAAEVVAKVDVLNV